MPCDAEPSVTPTHSDPVPTPARPSLRLCRLHPTQPAHSLKPGSTTVPSLQIRELRPERLQGQCEAAQLTSGRAGAQTPPTWSPSLSMKLSCFSVGVHHKRG